jgi:hypothetical protein
MLSECDDENRACSPTDLHELNTMGKLNKTTTQFIIKVRLFHNFFIKVNTNSFTQGYNSFPNIKNHTIFNTPILHRSMSGCKHLQS